MTEAYEILERRAAAQWAELHAKPWVRVGTGLMGMAAGAVETLAALRQAIADAGIEAASLRGWHDGAVLRGAYR